MRGLELIKNPFRALSCLVARLRGIPDKTHRVRGPGVAILLSTAFAAVALLAAAANFLGEQGARIVETHIYRDAAQRIASAPGRNRKSGADRQAASMAKKSMTATDLMLVLSRFDGAVQRYAESASADNAVRYSTLDKELERATAVFSTTLSPDAGSAASDLTRTIRNHRSVAAEVISAAQARRDSLNIYVTTLDSMSARIQQSLEGAWKIFGRVLARQSLLRMNANLDDLRRGATMMGSMQGPENTTKDYVLAAETVFASTLRDSLKSLQRSQGQAWVTAMTADFESVVALHRSLFESVERTQTLGRDLSQETTKLATTISAAVAYQPPAIERAPIADPSVSFVQLPLVEPVVDPAIDHWPLPARPITVTSKTVANDDERPSLVAWISVAVLLLLLYICAATVLSIVRPVRRLLHASRALANGESVAIVPLGGLRELDTLTVAFNEMAEQLSVARIAATQTHQRLELKVAERTRELKELAELDPLTGLPNRRHLFVLLGAAIEKARLADSRVGVFFVDIDNFKNINDSIGHAFGDQVLQAFARRLRNVAEDVGFAARLGGDEFTVVQESATDIDQIRAAGERIVHAFQHPLTIDGRELIVSVSIGASVYPDHEGNAEALLRAADAALFRAKAMGRSQLTLFTPELLTAAAQKFSIEQGLRRAIQKEEFELFFQPEVRVDTQSTHLVEALIRWRMPDGRYAAPAEFLAVAEESGLIMEISDWVLRTAIETTAQWHRGKWPTARVAINASPRQLLDYRFADRVDELLKANRLSASHIEIEITETVLQTGAATIDTLRRLRALGVAIALDDFGTGYSSLASLEQLPLTRVKLDRSLIASIDTSARSAAIVHAIMSLCQGLGLEVTAEGIERAEQFALLLDYPAMNLQGYLLAHPAPAGDLARVMDGIPRRLQDLLTAHADAIAPGRENVTPLRKVGSPQHGIIFGKR